MTCRHGHEHCPVCAGVNEPTPPVATAPIGFTPSVDPHCALISKTEYEASTTENAALKQRIAELEVQSVPLSGLEREELDVYRMKNGNGQIAAYYLLAEELEVSPGGSVVDTVHAHLTASRASEAALSARVEALEAELGVAYSNMEIGHAKITRLENTMWELMDEAGVGTKQNFDVWLSAHDERVKREVVERAIEQVMDCDCVGLLEGSEQLSIHEAIYSAAGIQPSTDTPIQEPK